MDEKAAASPRLRLWEFVWIPVLVVTVAAVLIPALGRVQEGMNRSVCANNLKQFGIISRLYADENDGVFPPSSVFLTPGSLMPDPLVLCPEYWTDPTLGLCPADKHGRTERADEWIPAISPMVLLSEISIDSSAHEEPGVACQHYLRGWSYSYFYTEYLVWDWDTMAAVDDARRSALEHGLVDTVELDMSGSPCGEARKTILTAAGLRDLDHLVPDQYVPPFGKFRTGAYIGSLPRFQQAKDLPDEYGILRVGSQLRKFWNGIYRIDGPDGMPFLENRVPIMWDAPLILETLGETTKPGLILHSHNPRGGNVLFMDGHVEFVREGKFPVGAGSFIHDRGALDPNVTTRFAAGEG